MDNNKDSQNQHSANDPIKWKSLGFFSAEEYLLYVFKKTEKITSALYAVSGLIKDDDPIKWELRDHGMDLLFSSFTASSSLPGDKNIVIQNIFTVALETISLLNIARVSGLISEMNHNILVKEIDAILEMLRDKLAQNVENAGYVLSESFFKTPSLFSTEFKSDSKNSFKINQNFNKGQILSSDKNKDRNTVFIGNEDSLNKKNKRQEEIINLLKNRSNLSVKDFTEVIKDCSEKTVQRELLDLVNKGVVKKDGERRWSRYSLK